MIDAGTEEVLRQFLRGDTPPPGMALKPASYGGAYGADPANTYVVIDGDTTPTPVSSLIGPVTPQARVMVLFWPPHGAYIVGIIGVTGSPWQTPTMTAGWEDYGSGYQSVQYRADGDWVCLRGLAARTSGSATTIFTVPAEYCPQNDETFATDSNSVAHSAIHVTAGGDVIWAAGSGATAAYVSLSGIRWAPYDFV